MAVKTIYLYRHVDHKPGDVHYWSDKPLPLHMLCLWKDEVAFSFHEGDTKVGGRTRIIVVTPEVAKLQDELRRCMNAMRQNPTPALASALKRVERALKKENTAVLGGRS